MGVVTFDTYESVKSLKAAGFQEAQAEALVAEMKKVQETSLADLATKKDIESVRHDLESLRHDFESLRNDLESLRHDLKQDIESLRKDTARDIKELELRLGGEINLLKWMVGFVFAGIISLVLKAFFLH